MDYMKFAKPEMERELISRDAVIEKLRSHLEKMEGTHAKELEVLNTDNINTKDGLQIRVSQLTSELGMKQILIDNGQRDVDNVVRDLELTNAVCDEMRSLIVRIAMGNS
jgi:hypothetical protein